MSRASSSAQSGASGCADKLKVLADATRLAVVARLFERPAHVGELVRELGVEQSLLSHHLRSLREAGLVLAERDGKAVLYRVAGGLTRSASGQTIQLGCCELSFPPRPRAKPRAR